MSRPACWSECAEAIIAQAASTGTEMNVMVCPPAFVVGDYPPFIATCPHGVTWLAEPTGEQIAEWVRTEAP